LQREEPVLELHLLGEEIRANRSLVLVTELLVHISELHITAQRKHSPKPTNKPTRIIIKKNQRNEIKSACQESIRIAGYWFIKDVFPTLDHRKTEVSERQKAKSPRRGEGREGDPKRSPAVAEDDDLEQGAAARGHRDLGPTRGGGDLLSRAGGTGRGAKGQRPAREVDLARESGRGSWGWGWGAVAMPMRCVLWWALERTTQEERKEGRPGERDGMCGPHRGPQREQAHHFYLRLFIFYKYIYILNLLPPIQKECRFRFLCHKFDLICRKYMQYLYL